MLFSIIAHNSLYDFLISMAHKMKDMAIAFLRWDLEPGGNNGTRVNDCEGLFYMSI